MSNSLVSLTNEAMKVALDEAAAGRQVMILVPNLEWVCALPRYELTHVWVRASTVESSLKSVPLDTLILVGQSHPEWNKKGEMYARELVGGSTPRVLVFDYPNAFWNR